MKQVKIDNKQENDRDHNANQFHKEKATKQTVNNFKVIKETQQTPGNTTVKSSQDPAN